MNNKLAGMRSIGRRVGSRAARALTEVASNLGESRFIVTRKLARPDNDGELLPLRYTYRANPEGLVDFTCLVSGSDVSFRLHAMSFVDAKVGAGGLVLACNLPAIKRGDVLTVNLLEPSISLNQFNVTPCRSATPRDAKIRFRDSAENWRTET